MKTRSLPPKISIFSIILLLGGCRSAAAHSPTLDVIGSYFPAWMACMILGIIITVIVRLLLIGLGIQAHLGPKVLVYPCMMVVFTLAIWLILFKN